MTDVTLAAAGMVTGGAATTSSTEDEHLWYTHPRHSFLRFVSSPTHHHTRTHAPPHTLSLVHECAHPSVVLSLPSHLSPKPSTIFLSCLSTSSNALFSAHPPRLVPFVNDLACATPTATHPPSQHLVSGRQWVASLTRFLLQHPWNMRHAPTPAPRCGSQSPTPASLLSGTEHQISNGSKRM